MVKAQAALKVKEYFAARLASQKPNVVASQPLQVRPFWTISDNHQGLAVSTECLHREVDTLVSDKLTDNQVEILSLLSGRKSDCVNGRMNHLGLPAVAASNPAPHELGVRNKVGDALSRSPIKFAYVT